MSRYRLAKEAVEDLQELASYTLKEWGQARLQWYRGGIEELFQAIGNGDLIGREFSDNYPELLYVRFKRHFVFYVTKGLEVPTIVGVLHERRDMVKELTKRTH